MRKFLSVSDNPFQNISGYILRHRFLNLLEDLDILSERQAALYQKLILDADWRISNSTYGTVAGTRQEIRLNLAREIGQTTFNTDFNRLLKFGLICQQAPRRWRLSNFQIHLSSQVWPKNLRKFKNTIPHFTEYLKNSLQNIEEEITEFTINEVSEMLLLFLANQEFFIQWEAANEHNKWNELTVKRKEWQYGGINKGKR